jgi:GntR family transcriptional regulator
MAILNRELPIPLYHQLKTLILREIEAGHWKPDQQLPTEEQLSARFHVSKITVRQALRELSNAGWVRREQGRGTFVQKPALEEGPRKLTSFTDEMRDHGIVASSQVLDKSVLAAPVDIAAKLEIPVADPVFRLRRLRLADGIAMGIQTAYLPLAMVPGIEEIKFTDKSLYEVLRSRYGLHPVSAKETLIAVVVNNEDASLLRVPQGSPALAAERMTFLPQARPLEYAQSLMRGDRYKIVLDLVRQPVVG